MTQASLREVAARFGSASSSRDNMNKRIVVRMDRTIKHPLSTDRPVIARPSCTLTTRRTRPTWATRSASWKPGRCRSSNAGVWWRSWSRRSSPGAVLALERVTEYDSGIYSSVGGRQLRRQTGHVLSVFSAAARRSTRTIGDIIVVAVKEAHSGRNGQEIRSLQGRGRADHQAPVRRKDGSPDPVQRQRRRHHQRTELSRAAPVFSDRWRANCAIRSS